MEQVNSAAAMIGAYAAILHMARVLLFYSAWQASWLSLQRASLAVVLVSFPCPWRRQQCASRVSHTAVNGKIAAGRLYRSHSW